MIIRDVNLNGEGNMSIIGVVNILCCIVYTHGILCVSDHDQCDPNPCQNGATCQDRIHDYMCVCPAGWTGKRCTRRRCM